MGKLNDLHPVESDEEDEHLRSFQVTVAAAQGGRKYMEDRIHIEAIRDESGNLEHIFAGVFDGHGGVYASQYVKENLHANIISNKLFKSKNDEDVLTAIRQGFIQTHNNMQKVVHEWPMTLSGYACTAGTTASIVILRSGKIYTGHVGDSAIFLCRLGDPDNERVLQLTEDHKPDDPNEKNRIESVGGQVAKKGDVTRVIWKRPSRNHKGPVRRSTSNESIPFLAVARALGDFWSLNPENNEYVVSPDPDLSVYELKREDSYILLASDGMTNVIQSTHVGFLLKTLNSDELPKGNFKTCDEKLKPNYAQYIMQQALDRWAICRADNISVVVIKLEHEELSLNPDSSVEWEDTNMNADYHLTEFPNSAIRITPKITQRILTNPMNLSYCGIQDNKIMENTDSKTAQFLHFKGPGFWSGPSTKPIQNTILWQKKCLMKRRRMSMSLETDVSLNNTGENDLTLNDDEITNSVNQEEALKENKNLKEIDQISDWKENCEKTSKADTFTINEGWTSFFHKNWLPNIVNCDKINDFTESPLASPLSVGLSPTPPEIVENVSNLEGMSMQICSQMPSTSNALKSVSDKLEKNLPPKLMLESIRTKAAIEHCTTTRFKLNSKFTNKPPIYSSLALSSTQQSRSKSEPQKKSMVNHSFDYLHSNGSTYDPFFRGPPQKENISSFVTQISQQAIVRYIIGSDSSTSSTDDQTAHGVNSNFITRMSRKRTFNSSDGPSSKGYFSNLYTKYYSGTNLNNVLPNEEMPPSPKRSRIWNFVSSVFSKFT